MLVCYDAAKSLCRLQEAIVANFGLTGLQCMQRGYSFTVYAGLSCIVLHLVSSLPHCPCHLALILQSGCYSLARS
jgi:hypothetical protein